MAEATVDAVMTGGVVTVGMTTPVEEIIRELIEHRVGAVPVLAARRPAESGVRRLFVLGDGQLVGVVTRGDLLRPRARTGESR